MDEDMDEDLDETDRLEQEIAREIEAAFADVPYPGDDKLVDDPDSYEGEKFLAAFRGRHWREITLEVLFLNRSDHGQFLPEGLRFYLPCFMIGALLHTSETDTLWQSVFSDLTPPESEGPCMDWFLKLVNLLDARQKAAVRRYVEIYVQIETSFPNPDKDRALAFWRRITDPALLN